MRIEKYDGDERIAYIFYDICETMIEITDLWVNEDYRRKGLGTSLLCKIFKISITKKLPIEADIDPYESTSDLSRNKKFIKLLEFYEKLGFKSDPDYPAYITITVNTMKRILRSYDC